MSIQRRSVNTARRTLPYLYRPADASEPAPLVVFLHGAKDRGTDLGLLLAWGLPKIVAAADKLPYHFLALQIPPETSWADWEGELFSLIDRVSLKHHIDPARVVLAGFSLGTAGAWLIGSAHPARFAGLALVSGRVPEAIDEGRLANLQHTPVWIFHGELDDRAPVEDARVAAESLRATGGDVRFTIVAGGDHFIAEAAYGDARLQQWLAAPSAFVEEQIAA